MAIKFTITDSVVDHSSIFSGVNGPMEDADIKIESTSIIDSKLFTDLNVSAFCTDINRISNTLKMSRKERKSILKVLEKKQNKSEFTLALMEHILNFTEGVAANVVANLIGPR